jgi:hypothetical protein
LECASSILKREIDFGQTLEELIITTETINRHANEDSKMLIMSIILFLVTSLMFSKLTHEKILAKLVMKYKWHSLDKFLLKYFPLTWHYLARKYSNYSNFRREEGFSRPGLVDVSGGFTMTKGDFTLDYKVTKLNVALNKIQPDSIVEVLITHEPSGKQYDLSREFLNSCERDIVLNDELSEEVRQLLDNFGLVEITLEQLIEVG